MRQILERVSAGQRKRGGALPGLERIGGRRAHLSCVSAAKHKELLAARGLQPSQPGPRRSAAGEWTIAFHSQAPRTLPFSSAARPATRPHVTLRRRKRVRTRGVPYFSIRDVSLTGEPSVSLFLGGLVRRRWRFLVVGGAWSWEACIFRSVGARARVHSIFHCAALHTMLSRRELRV